jgi:hypothetical protein
MLIDDMEHYLALRRSLGFKLERAGEYLSAFADFAAAPKPPSSGPDRADGGRAV